MGRRHNDPRLPSGVQEKKGRWYWRPSTKHEREERKAKGLPEAVRLGPAGSIEARTRWAELTGHRTPEEEANAGRVREILVGFKDRGIAKKPNGRPRAKKTIKEYTASIDRVLLPRFGAMAYGKSSIEASRGKAIGTVDVQRFVRDLGNTYANRHVAAMSAAFRWAIGDGLTIYNPCLGVARNAEEPRTREPLPWEWECLRTMADANRSKLMGLIMDFEAINGWRISDILNLKDRQLTAEGIKLVQGKRGKRQLWGWSDEQRRIIAEALQLPGAAQDRFPLTPVFPSRSGEQLTLDGFESNWQRLRRRTNAALDGKVERFGALSVNIPLKIVDLHFHDNRSTAGDEAEEAGFNIAEFLGNNQATAERHYRRRERKVMPLDELRKRKAG